MDDQVDTNANRHSKREKYELSCAIEESLLQQRVEQKRALQNIRFEIASCNSTSRRRDEEEDLGNALPREELELSKALEESVQSKQMRDDAIRMNRNATDWQIQRTRDSNEGSWDCVKCTFANEPYRPGCAVCRADPPPHVLAFVSMPDCRFGVEIEVIVPEGRRDGFTLESVARRLTRRSSEDGRGHAIPVHYAGYSHETSDYWKIVTDSSIRESNGNRDLCFELVSPILKGESGLFSMRTLMEHLRELGIETNRSCGFHVHVDAEEGSDENDGSIGSLNGLVRISQCFVALENAFDLLVQLHEDNANGNDDTISTTTCKDDDTRRAANANQYCRSNRLQFGSKSNKQRWGEISRATTKQQLVQIVNPDNDRYKKLNLTNIPDRDRPATVEFRQHGGVVNLQEAEAWVRLVLSFCARAAGGGPAAEACLLPEGSSPRTELWRLFDLVNCRGLEQFFSVDRGLFAEGRLRNEWRCVACGKEFGHSRSLAQHAAACGH